MNSVSWFGFDFSPFRSGEPLATDSETRRWMSTIMLMFGCGHRSQAAAMSLFGYWQLYAQGMCGRWTPVCLTRPQRASSVEPMFTASRGISRDRSASWLAVRRLRDAGDWKQLSSLVLWLCTTLNPFYIFRAWSRGRLFICRCVWQGVFQS